MRLTKQLLEDTVKEAVGEDVLRLVDFLKSRKNISEFKIAEKIKTDVNKTRNMLYRLHDKNLAFYHRKKDRQKGWYISYWTFNLRHVKDLVQQLKAQKMERLRERLAKEEKHHGNFFMCKKGCARLDFDSATDFEYKCPECGLIMLQQDNQKTIEHLTRQIQDLEKETKK
jgi:transcription initiation factor TFIIE subunit alpha